MTDRYKGFVVSLDEDMRSDDAEALIVAIRQLRGVIAVEPVVANMNDHITAMQLKSRIADALWKALNEVKL